MRKLIVVAIVAAAVCGAVVGWTVYRNSPRYAFSQIEEAILTQDKDRFYQFVDLDSAVSRGVDDFLAYQAASKDSGLDSALATGLVALMKPKLVETVRGQVDRMIERGHSNADDNGLLGFAKSMREQGAVKWTKRDGKVSTVAVEMKHAKYGTPVEIQFRLREHEGHLQVIEIANLRDVVAKIDEADRLWLRGASSPSLRDALCNSVNEQDLESVAKCYNMGKPSDPWRFLSKESQSEDPRDAFNKRFFEIHRWSTRSVRVLGIDTKDGRVFGRVEEVVDVANTPEKHCDEVSTESWIQESGSWRRVRLPRTHELANQQFKNGDYSATVNTAEKWLSQDPFSVEAYRKLVFALTRGGRGAQGERSVTDTLRATLAVNPADSVGLFTAVSLTNDSDVAETLFDRFPANDCRRDEAAFNLANALSPRRRLAFLEKTGARESSMEMMLIKTVLDLGDTRRLKTLLTVDVEKRVRTHLDQQNGTYAAHWSVSMGEAWLAIENKETAKEWALYAATRNPNLPEVAGLIGRVR